MDQLHAGKEENHGHTRRRNSVNVCGQGLSAEGVLSLLLWSLFVDELVEGLNENGCNQLGYADDIALLVSG
jgi:hypothetical protein